MVIDKNKPLPPHTKLDYWECYAKIVLEELLPEKFTNLMLADKPDLQDNDGCVGVEVTRAENPKQVEAESLYSTLHYKNEKKKAHDIDRIEKLGARVHDGFMMGITSNDSFEFINSAIDVKCKTLLKGGYKEFNEYHLFLFSPIYAVDYMLQEELQYLIAEDIVKTYRVIYVLVPGGMYCFDLTTNKYKVFDIDSNMQHRQATKARQMVEEGEVMQQGYKQTEIGVIPADWEICVAKDLYLKARIGWQGLKKDEYLDDGYYYLVTGTDFLDNKISWKNCHYVLQERYDQDKNIQLSTGDILITKDGSIGKTAFVDTLDKPATLNSGIFLVRPKNDKIDQTYLYFVFKSEYFNKFLKDLTAGSTIVHLYQKDFVAFKYPIPKRKEQERIAKAIIDVDSMISSLEKLILKKKALKQGVMHELLTGKKRLPGFTGEWTFQEMKANLRFQVGYPFSSDYFNSDGLGLRLIKNRDLKSDDQVYYTTETYDQAFIVRDGDVLVGMDGDFIPCLWKKGISLLNQRVGRIQVTEKMNLVFAHYCLQKPLTELQEGTGATTVKHLSHKDIEKMVIKIPVDVCEQAAIASVLTDMDNEIGALEQKLEKARQVKQGMMQQLLTGKIRLV